MICVLLVPCFGCLHGLLLLMLPNNNLNEGYLYQSTGQREKNRLTFLTASLVRRQISYGTLNTTIYTGREKIAESLQTSYFETKLTFTMLIGGMVDFSTRSSSFEVCSFGVKTEHRQMAPTNQQEIECEKERQKKKMSSTNAHRIMPYLLQYFYNRSGRICVWCVS